MLSSSSQRQSTSTNDPRAARGKALPPAPPAPGTSTPRLHKAASTWYTPARGTDPTTTCASAQHETSVRQTECARKLSVRQTETGASD